MRSQPLPPSNQLFQYLFEQASLGVAVEDLEGTLLLANPALCSMLGYSVNELVGMSCSQFANPEDSEDDWALFQQLRAGVIEKYSLEKRYVRKDGARLWGRLNVSLLKNSGEESEPLVFAFVENITERRHAEEELRQRDAELTEVQRLAGLGSWQWDAKTDQVSWSKETHLRAGHDPSLPVPTFREQASLFTAESWGRLERAVQDAMQTGASYELDVEIADPKSTVKWVITRGEPVRDARGQIIGLRGTIQDITERKWADKALRESEERFRLAMQASKSVGWEWDLKSGLDSWFGDLQTMFGISADTFVGRTDDFFRFVHTEDRAMVAKAVADARQSGASYVSEFRLVRPDGTTRWVAATGQFHYAADGDPTRMLGMAVDITERKRAEVALRESEQRLRLAVQAGKMYTFDWDVATDVIARSKESVHILKWEDPEHDSGREFHARVHPDDRAVYDVTEARLTPENPTYQINFQTLCPDGTATWLEDTGRASFDSHGKIVRVIGMVADITERKRAEQALATLSRRLIAAQEQERMRIGRELHDDIGQRLALLAVELQRLQDSSVTLPVVRRRMGELQKQTSAIAIDIQSLSHQLHSAKLQYLGIASAMRGFCREISEQQGVEVEFNTHDLSVPLSADVSLCLFRVLQEALHNSAKHSGSKRVEVRLWGATDEIHLTVRDFGGGFDLETAKTTPGLGLISMEERLRLVNGTLSIDARPDQGTTIHARVPVGSASESLRPTG